jgi:hypothetical protein
MPVRISFFSIWKNEKFWHIFHSEETKAKMRATRRGRKLSDQHRAKIRASLLGHEVSEKR